MRNRNENEGNNKQQRTTEEILFALSKLIRNKLVRYYLTLNHLLHIM